MYILSFIVTILLGLTLLPTPVQAQQELLEGTITELVSETKRSVLGEIQTVREFKIQLTSGNEIGVTTDYHLKVGGPQYQIGDQVVVTKSIGPNHQTAYFLTDYVRRKPLAWLLIIFLGLTLVVARKRGLYSILGLGISFLLMFYLVLPYINRGFNPVFITLLAAAVMIPLNFYLSHGINAKTTVAIVGTLISLVATGLLAQIAIAATHLTGYASEEAIFLQSASNGVVHIKGLIMAGLLISVLGILDDITVSQAAIVMQLRRANQKLTPYELYHRAMDVGQDHISSIVNTLILVYTGAAFPLLLLFTQSELSFFEVVNYEIIAEEIVRTLLASIGLILAVPITTGLAAWMAKRSRPI